MAACDHPQDGHTEHGPWCEPVEIASMEPRAGLLTEEEQLALGLTGELHRQMILIIGPGPARIGDTAELVTHIHAIQHMIMSQAAARAYPLLYRMLGGDHQ